MSIAGRPNAEAAAERSFENLRVFDAPRVRVFRAWTDPEQLKRWWGPEGFTNTFHEFDPRPGGQWRFVMRGPDGKEYANHSTFVELTEPERIVLDHVSSPRFRLTATFEAVGEKTRLTFNMLFETVAEYDVVRHSAVAANEQNLDRLQAELSSVG